ncbi:STAS domain-containing protein [Streptomyces sp. NPDC005562]|uniref:STAS domain-containing protein n=1 Tax=unclassified Streptomyces TaxID=2593676 RepID=UPI0033AEB40D
MTEPVESQTARRQPMVAEVTLARRGRAAVVRATGALDSENVAALDGELARAAELAGQSRTVVDLSALEFADSSVLHVLLDAQRRHRAGDRQLVVCGPLRPVVDRLFGVTGTTEFFVLAEDVDTAVNAAPVKGTLA